MTYIISLYLSYSRQDFAQKGFRRPWSHQEPRSAAKCNRTLRYAKGKTEVYSLTFNVRLCPMVKKTIWPHLVVLRLLLLVKLFFFWSSCIAHVS